MIQKPRGTRDFLPDEMAQRRELEQKMRKVAASFGYGEVMTPMFEEQELFVLKSGEAEGVSFLPFVVCWWAIGK